MRFEAVEKASRERWALPEVDIGYRAPRRWCVCVASADRAAPAERGVVLYLRRGGVGGQPMLSKRGGKNIHEGQGKLAHL